MSFTRCNYSGCSEIRRRSKFRFYTFPINDETRCDVWIKASGNSKLLEYDRKQMKNMCLCEKHFEENAFVNETHHRLIPTAVPKYYDRLPEETPGEAEKLQPTVLIGKLLFIFIV